MGTLEDEERSARQDIDQELEEQNSRKSETERNLIRSMEKAQSEDTGALAEIGSELVDVPAYLERLEQLEKESLPEKLNRFLEYLNLSSGQGVTQLLAQVDSEVVEIEERIGDLNKTLMRVNFRGEQYLQLRPRRVGHESVRQLERSQKKLRLAALSDTNDHGEAHYRALEDVIRLLREAAENRRTLAAQALLDPRHRLQFFVVEVDRSTGRESGQRTGTQTGSGGEKEMMASYILTASLSYALCPPGAARPRYSTIVLDEAFSKSSPAAAVRIIEALKVFCLHPLFVTPEKELGLLKQHTRSAILVYKKDEQATLTSLSWRQLEEYENARLFSQ